MARECRNMYYMYISVFIHTIVLAEYKFKSEHTIWRVNTQHVLTYVQVYSHTLLWWLDLKTLPSCVWNMFSVCHNQIVTKIVGPSLETYLILLLVFFFFFFFYIRWVLQSPYWRSHWTYGIFFHKVANFRHDVFSSHGVRLSPLGTAATVWRIVQAPHDRWWWLWSNRWNANWQGKRKYSEETCPSATLSTTNPTWPDPGSNWGRRGGKPATNRLSYGKA
jgi:hypothetical protein